MKEKIVSPSGNVFEWKETGFIYCHDWDNKPTFKNGLFGLLYGEGGYRNFIIGGLADILFLVCKVDDNDLIVLPSQVKFKNAEIIYTGNLYNSILYLKDHIGIVTFLKLVYLSVQFDRYNNIKDYSRYEDLFKLFSADTDHLNFLIEYGRKFDKPEFAIYDLCKPNDDFILSMVSNYAIGFLSSGDERGFKKLLKIAIESLFTMGLNPHYFNLTESSFIHHSSLHGVNHVYRVMINSIIMSLVLKLNVYDSRAVFMSAFLHDLGRKHDGFCLDHGQYCIDLKFENYKPLIEKYIGLNGYNELIKEAIIFHCKPDHQAPDNEILHLLKDADALDRCRLGDLNPRYLRNEKTHLMIPFSEWLYRSSPDEIFPFGEFVEKTIS